jgi:hypothetical protein
MKPVSNFEPLPHTMAVKIAQSGWPVIDAIDEAFGAATVDKSCKAVWTTTGKRVEVSMISGGGLIVSQSKDVDPIYTERKMRI